VLSVVNQVVRPELLPAEVKLGQAERERDRTQKLRSRNAGMVAVQEYDAVSNFESARAALSVSRAALTIARADLAEAEANLG
jgi:hypothetical protein